MSNTVTVTKVFILRFLRKDRKRITVIYIYSAKARLNKTVLRQRLKDVVVVLLYVPILWRINVCINQHNVFFDRSKNGILNVSELKQFQRMHNAQKLIVKKGDSIKFCTHFLYKIHNQH